MDLGLPVPDFSTFSLRGRVLNIADEPQLANGPITLIVDSTGLQVHSSRAWMQQKHGIKKLRKTWRKLHIGFDPDSGKIVTSTLTTEHVDDEIALPDLCATRHPVNRFLGDGAYDGAPSEAVIREAFGCDVELLFRLPAVQSTATARCETHTLNISKSTAAWPGSGTLATLNDLALKPRLGATNQSLAASFKVANWRPNKPKQPSV